MPLVTDVCVQGHRIVYRTAEQVIDRDAQHLATQIPQCDIDGAAQLFRRPGQTLQHYQVVPETLALTPTSSAITVMSPAKGLVTALVML